MKKLLNLNRKTRRTADEEAQAGVTCEGGRGLGSDDRWRCCTLTRIMGQPAGS